jgi:hypothetical protein
MTNNKPMSPRKSSRAKTTPSRYTSAGNEPLRRMHLQTSLDQLRESEAVEAARSLQLQQYYDAVQAHSLPVFVFGAPVPPPAAPAAPVFVFGAASAAPVSFGLPVSNAPHPFHAPPLVISQVLAQELHELFDAVPPHVEAPANPFHYLQLAAQEAWKDIFTF